MQVSLPQMNLVRLESGWESLFPKPTTWPPPLEPAAAQDPGSAAGESLLSASQWLAGGAGLGKIKKGSFVNLLRCSSNRRVTSRAPAGAESTLLDRARTSGHLGTTEQKVQPGTASHSSWRIWNNDLILAWTLLLVLTAVIHNQCDLLYLQTQSLCCNAVNLWQGTCLPIHWWLSLCCGCSSNVTGSEIKRKSKVDYRGRRWTQPEN